MYVPRVKDSYKDTRDLLREDGDDLFTLLAGFAEPLRDVFGCRFVLLFVVSVFHFVGIQPLIGG